MRKSLVSLLGAFLGFIAWGQEVALPPDFRQHNLTQFNASLLNPAFAVDWNNPNAFSVWTRWQWQTLDGDPTTLFANYTHQIGDASIVGLGFLQHNTGIFLYTGGNINFAQTVELAENIRFMAGLNMYAFQETLADEQFVSNSGLDPIVLEDYKNFRMQFSPGLRLMVHQTGIGIAFENAFGFILSGDDAGNNHYFKTFMGTVSQDIPVSLFESQGRSIIRPVAYIKSIPDGDTQYGLNGLLSTPYFWVQGGYNSFYGPSGGVGITLAKSFSIGGLVEFGTDASLDEKDPTLELIASYHFGKSNRQIKVEEEPETEEDNALEMERAAQLQREKDSIALLQREAELLAAQRKKDSIDRVNLQRQKDSIAQLQAQKVELRPNEKYEEVENEEGLEPGFYLIANVYGTKKYFDNFMKTLREKGLEPKSFYRKLNKYNYVYLERYNTMGEARKARDSQFFGKYADKTWIFRVKGN